MFGIINDAIENFVISAYGEDVWASIKAKAHCDIPNRGWVANEDFPDDLTFRIMHAASGLLGLSTDTILEELGKFFLYYASTRGFDDDFLRCQGRTLQEWLKNINDVHNNLQYALGKESLNSFPEFYFIEETPSPEHPNTMGLLLYKSKRGAALTSLVTGLVKDAAKRYYNSIVDLEKVVTQDDATGEGFTYWRLHKIGEVATTGGANEANVPSSLNSGSNDNNVPSPATVDSSVGCEINHRPFKVAPVAASNKGGGCPFSKRTAALTGTNRQNKYEAHTAIGVPEKVEKGASPRDEAKYRREVLKDGGITGERLKTIFPYHVTVDHNFVITHMGSKLADIVPGIMVGGRVDQWLDITLPVTCSWNWEDILVRRDAAFDLETHLNIDNEDGVSDAMKVRLTGGVYITDEELPEEEEGGIYVDEERSQQFPIDGRTTVGQVGRRRVLRSATFLVQPDVESLSEMMDFNLSWSDFPKHSSQQRLIYLSEHLKSETVIGQQSRSEVQLTQRMLEMKRMFVRYVSHEIRTPLNTVSMGLKLIQSLRTRDSADQSVFDMADEIKESCDIAIDILNDLLLYEKLEGGILTLDRRCEAALAVVHEAVKVFSIQARQANVKLECSFDPASFARDELRNPTTFMDIDKPKVSQVLRNLVSNAIKFSPAGKCNLRDTDGKRLGGYVTIHSSVICEEPDESAAGDATVDPNIPEILRVKPEKKKYLRVQVTDSGPGISAENQAKLFDQIIQFDPNRLQGGQGSGLGLFISKRIMDLHRGRIGVYSAGEGKGTRFHIDIPIHTEDEKCHANDVFATVPQSNNAKAGATTSRSDDSPHSQPDEHHLKTDIFSEFRRKTYPTDADGNTTFAGGHTNGSPRRSPGPRNQSPYTHALPKSAKVYHSSPVIEHKVEHTQPQIQVPKQNDVLLMPKVAVFDSRDLSSHSIAGIHGNEDNDVHAHGDNHESPDVRLRPNISFISRPDMTPSCSTSSVEGPERIFIPTRRLSASGSASGSGNNSRSSSVVATPLSSAHGSRAGSPTPPSFNILVVDDSVATRKMLVRFLKLKKYCDCPDEASDGAEALEMVIASLHPHSARVHVEAEAGNYHEELHEARQATSAYDAVLMDFIMPTMDGPTATKKIRQAGFKGLIVGLTGNVLPEDKAFFIEQGADAVLGKPVDMAQLMSLLMKHCGHDDLFSPRKRAESIDQLRSSVSTSGLSISSLPSAPPLSLPQIAEGDGQNQGQSPDQSPDQSQGQSHSHKHDSGKFRPVEGKDNLNVSQRRVKSLNAVGGSPIKADSPLLGASVSYSPRSTLIVQTVNTFKAIALTDSDSNMEVKYPTAACIATGRMTEDVAVTQTSLPAAAAAVDWRRELESEVCGKVSSSAPVQVTEHPSKSALGLKDDPSSALPSVRSSEDSSVKVGSFFGVSLLQHDI